MKLKLAALVVSSVLSTQILADSYFGANYSIVDTDFSEPTALSLKYGRFVNENIAIEGRLALGLQDDNIDGLPGVKADVENMYGVYGIYNFAPSSKFNPYALVGYTKAKFGIDAGALTDSVSENDLSFGLGADIQLSKTAAVNVEWASLLDKNDGEATAFSVGLTWKF